MTDRRIIALPPFAQPDWAEGGVWWRRAGAVSMVVFCTLLYALIALPFAALFHGATHVVLRNRLEFGPVLTGALLGFLLAALLLPLTLPPWAQELDEPPQAVVVPR